MSMNVPLLSGLLVLAAILMAPGREPESVRGDAVEIEQLGAREGEGAGVLGHEDSAEAPMQDEAPTQDEVASALVLLALAYRSGLPTWRVLEAVAEAMTPVGHLVVRDLRQVAAALRWGASDDEAWASVGAVWSGAGRAVAIAHRAGIAPGPLLLTAADDLRRAALEQVELAAARVGVRLVAPMGLVLLPAFLLTTVVPLVLALGRQMLNG